MTKFADYHAKTEINKENNELYFSLQASTTHISESKESIEGNLEYILEYYPSRKGEVSNNYEIIDDNNNLLLYAKGNIRFLDDLADLLEEWVIFDQDKGSLALNLECYKQFRDYGKTHQDAIDFWCMKEGKDVTNVCNAYNASYSKLKKSELSYEIVASDLVEGLTNDQIREKYGSKYIIREKRINKWRRPAGKLRKNSLSENFDNHSAV